MDLRPAISRRKTATGRHSGLHAAVLVTGIVLLVPFITRHMPGHAGSRSFTISMRMSGRVPPDTRAGVVTELRQLHVDIGRDLNDFPERLTVRLFGTHREYARALANMHVEGPQSTEDNSSNVVDGTLLLGPLQRSFLRHNLAHVYTEWLIDRIIGNVTDAIPADPWLYDGLAEYEAFRYAPAGLQCRGSGQGLLDVTRIRTPAEWMRVRAGPLGPVEYCLAYLRVKRIVARLGWPSVRTSLHASRDWHDAVRRLTGARS